MFYEEPTNPDDILGFKKIKDAHPDVKLATGEMIQNAVMFKQFIENKSLDYCQIDSCRIASINEILPVLLIASKYDIPVIRLIVAPVLFCTSQYHPALIFLLMQQTLCLVFFGMQNTM